KVHRARVRLSEASDDIEQCGLSRPRGAEERHELPLAYAEGYVIEHHGRTETLVRRADRNGEGVGHSAPAARGACCSPRSAPRTAGAGVLARSQCRRMQCGTQLGLLWAAPLTFAAASSSGQTPYRPRGSHTTRRRGEPAASGCPAPRAAASVDRRE